jgi:hypothetical protein
MVDQPEPPFQRNDAPELPHFGKTYVYHGPGGVLTFRIDTQSFTHDGLVMMGGIVLHGAEVAETGHVTDVTGQYISVFITESQYMRLTNAPLK